MRRRWTRVWPSRRMAQSPSRAAAGTPAPVSGARLGQKSSLRKYFKDSGNIKMLKFVMGKTGQDLRGQLLKHTKHDIVDSLSVLSETQHDISSFLVDIDTRRRAPASSLGQAQRAREHSDGSSSPQGENKGRDSSQGSFGKENFHDEHDGYELPPPHLQKEDENVEVGDAHEDPQIRNNPSTLQPNSRSVECRSEYQDRIPPEREVEKNTQNGDLGTWFKVTIPYGIKYDKTWIVNSIQSHCNVPFTPVAFHYNKNQAHFFVQDVSAACALKKVNCKIHDEKNQKVFVFVNLSTKPQSMQKMLKPKEMAQLKLTLNKRYDVSQQALDLQRLRFDPDLVKHHIDIILNRRNCMAATLKIIERNFPELLSLNLCDNKLHQLDGLPDIIEKAPKVKTLNLSKNKLKSAWELGKVKGLKLEELWLEGNPLCSTFSDQSTYVSTIREYFPKLLRLDGQELGSPIIIGIEAPEIIKPCKESYKGSETIKSLVLQFLLQYYLIYDSEDRKGLLSVYHDKACFSLTITLNPEDPEPSSLEKYFKDSRNIKNIKDPHLRVQLLKHTKREIVDSLSVLPRTQHDLNSYVVDLCIQTVSTCFLPQSGPESWSR
ncbi:nuclear RNA export factor 5-like [Macaca thibetana thibetana]|uniref:nuclear RNA export factor 5-like n=1 Tax=Macaca thibetana thibetana TaxID=257877 RepID=UPI0021BC7E33|nr:nuclear RNA export factor 5-like [Macaca thibetana thibetana]